MRRVRRVGRMFKTGVCGCLLSTSNIVARDATNPLDCCNGLGPGVALYAGPEALFTTTARRR